jgi:DNA-binding NtrC family response regulator
VVEDEPELRRLSALMLARLDVEVLLAGDVPAAREVLNRREVDLIVSDVKMPGESGIDFYSWIRVQRPAMASRFLFVTGDLTMPELGEFAAEHPMAVIHKPFEVQDYLQRVRSMLA